MEYRNLQGENLKKTYEYLRNKGYIYLITYNNTDELFYFIDRFFKTEAGAKKFFNSLKCDKKEFKKI